MAFELEGLIVEIYPAQQVSEKMKKVEFVIDNGTEYNGSYYNNFIKFQLINEKCNKLDGFAKGDHVTVKFGHKGSKSVKEGKTNYFINLNAYEVVSNTTEDPVTYEQRIENFRATLRGQQRG